MSQLTFPFPETPTLGSACPVLPGIWWVALPIQSALETVNVWLLEDDGAWTIVDCGTSSDESLSSLKQAIQDTRLPQLPIKRIIVTHFHPDHVGGAGRLCVSDTCFETSRVCFETAHRLHADQPSLPRPEQIEFLRSAGYDRFELSAIERSRPIHYADTVAAIPASFEELQQDDVLMIGARRWTVHLGNGHAEGHVTLWSNDGVALVGDQILPSVAPNLSVHYRTANDDTIAPWIESCRRLSQFADDNTLLLPGHGRPFRGGDIRCQQLIDNCERVLERLEQILVRPMTAVDCLKSRFRRSMSDYERRLLIADTIGYLNHLHRNERIKRHRSSAGQYLWHTVRRPLTSLAKTP